MKRLLWYLFVFGLMVLFLVLFLRKTDPRTVIELIATTNVAWLILAVLGNAAALQFRTARWRIILSPEHPPSYYSTFFATAVGYMLSMMLPVRAADLTRPALLSRRSRIGFSSALGTMLTERILDLLSMLSLFVVFYLTSGSRFRADPGLAVQARILTLTAGVALIIVVAMLTLVFSIYFFGAGVRRFHEKLGRVLPARFREGWMRFFDSFAGTLQIVHHRSAFLRVLLLTGGVWLSLGAQFYFVLLAFRRPLPFMSSFFVAGMTIVGLIFPTPAGVGGYHKACQIALVSFYQFDVNTSVAVALIFHIVGVAPVILTGLILFVHEGLSWRLVSRIAEGEPPEQMARDLIEIGETDQE